MLDYLRRIVRFTSIEKTCLLIVMHYIDQICARMPVFTISSLTCHRFVITAVALASKTLCDAFCTNTYYARIGGITTHELGRLEREFLLAIDWRLTVSPFPPRPPCTREVLQLYYENLVSHSGGRFIIIGAQSGGSISSDSDVDIEFIPSRSVSPIDEEPGPVAGTSSTRPHEASTILIDRATLSPEIPRGPTVEQNMAFEQFQRSLGRP
ncbi:hypothetical protein EW146_g4875 [Bondarzewia mesenterica]|uniref:Cyclin n=1 Tax=Bondarzewia mesenterica TaxID=1095465 RepID=A0A4S4LT85_9AGAM|nr:hypothetical protein EW146_g4875 [Bondarzewia mesenterica]